MLFGKIKLRIIEAANNQMALPTNQGREGFVRLRALSFNINFQSELEPLCEVVFPNGYQIKPAFNLTLVEFNNVSTGITKRGNKNYLTFMKISKIFGKIILCKRLPHVNKKYKKPNTFVALQRWSQDINRKVGVFFYA